jgi:hypothetical protein
MTIDIQRECGGGVTQIALKGLDVVAVSDRDDSILVSEIVKAELRTAHAFDDALEAIIDGAIGQNEAPKGFPSNRDDTWKTLGGSALKSHLHLLHRLLGLLG